MVEKIASYIEVIHEKEVCPTLFREVRHSVDEVFDGRTTFNRMEQIRMELRLTSAMITSRGPTGLEAIDIKRRMASQIARLLYGELQKDLIDIYEEIWRLGPHDELEQLKNKISTMIKKTDWQRP